MDIATEILSKYPKECRKKIDRSKRIVSDDELLAQLSSEMSRIRRSLQAKGVPIQTTQDWPTKYYYEESPTTFEPIKIRNLNQ